MAKLTLPSKYCGPGAVGEQGDGPPLSGLTCEHNQGVRMCAELLIYMLPYHTAHTISAIHTVSCAQTVNLSYAKNTWMTHYFFVFQNVQYTNNTTSHNATCST